MTNQQVELSFSENLGLLIGSIGITIGLLGTISKCGEGCRGDSEIPRSATYYTEIRSEAGEEIAELYKVRPVEEIGGK